MGRMNIYFDEEEDDKLHNLKAKFKLKSKEDVIKKLIKDSNEEEDQVDEFNLGDVDII